MITSIIKAAQPVASAPPQTSAHTPLQTSRLSDQLAARLQALIDGGTLAPGERLPTETQLAAAHGVSRTVVREAVHQLKSQRLLLSRQGSGVYVATAQAERSLHFDSAVPGSEAAVMQMFEVRRALEGEMAALAAGRATRRQLATLRRSAAAFDEAVAAGRDGVQEDLAFHQAIAAASGNPQFGRLLEHLGQYLRGAMLVTGDAPQRARSLAAVQREHAAIVAAIEAGNAAAARRQALGHLRGTMRRVANQASQPRPPAAPVLP